MRPLGRTRAEHGGLSRVEVSRNLIERSIIAVTGSARAAFVTAAFGPQSAWKPRGKAP